MGKRVAIFGQAVGFGLLCAIFPETFYFHPIRKMLAACVALVVAEYDWEEMSCQKAKLTNTWALAK